MLHIYIYIYIYIYDISSLRVKLRNRPFVRRSSVVNAISADNGIFNGGSALINELLDIGTDIE